MNPVNKNSSGIPSRKDVHFRTPSSDNKSNKNTSFHKIAASVSSKKEQNISNSGVKTNNNLKSDTEIKKTPVQLSQEKSLVQRENSLKSRLALEIKKNSLLKKQLRKRFFEKLKFKTVCLFVACGIGFIAFTLFAVFLIFTYYRSITKYRPQNTDYAIVGYDYIDMSDTNEKNIEKIEDRKSGKEQYALNLNDKIFVYDSNAYVPYSAINDFFSLSVAGDAESRTIIIGNSNSDYDGANTAQFRFSTNEITVNGASQMLSCTSLLKNGELYIPFEFIELFVNGITIDKRTDNDKINITITKTEPIIHFGGSSNMPLNSPAMAEYFGDSQAIHSYSVDVSAYEKYINPEDKDKYLLIVNATNSLSADFVPDDLINVKTNPSRPTQQVCRDAGMSLAALLYAADAAGFGDLAVNGGYRSYSHQTSMFNQKLEQNLNKYDRASAEKITAESVLYPGTSEHQSGLCVDLHNMTTPMQSFSNTDAYRWLIEHCADFGFILRYPQSKEGITGVKFEPWHFRFVGRTHAQKIMSDGISLEEYLAEYSPKK